jgi:hypothetical protein
VRASIFKPHVIVITQHIEVHASEEWRWHSKMEGNSSNLDCSITVVSSPGVFVLALTLVVTWESSGCPRVWTFTGDTAINIHEDSSPRVLEVECPVH